MAQGWGALAPSLSRGALAPLQSTEVLARLRHPRGQRLLNPLVLIFIYKGGLTGLWRGGVMGEHSQGRLSLLPQVGGAAAGAGRSVLPAKNQGRSSQGELSPKGESHLLKVEDTGGVHAGALVGRASGHTEVHPTLTAPPVPPPAAAVSGGPGDHTYVLGRG